MCSSGVSCLRDHLFYMFLGKTHAQTFEYGSILQFFRWFNPFLPFSWKLQALFLNVAKKPNLCWTILLVSVPKIAKNDCLLFHFPTAASTWVPHAPSSGGDWYPWNIYEYMGLLSEDPRVTIGFNTKSCSTDLDDLGVPSIWATSIWGSHCKNKQAHHYNTNKLRCENRVKQSTCKQKEHSFIYTWKPNQIHVWALGIANIVCWLCEIDGHCGVKLWCTWNSSRSATFCLTSKKWWLPKTVATFGTPASKK